MSEHREESKAVFTNADNWQNQSIRRRKTVRLECEANDNDRKDSKFRQNLDKMGTPSNWN